MQSIFIKMTGFQEQKLKCIVWELATDDYEYRYHKLTDKLGGNVQAMMIKIKFIRK
jgi:hypothetical protein